MSEEIIDSPVANGSAGYEVEGEPGVYWCAKHSKVKTRLRCGRCEKPICTKCTKYGPTGARCPDCVSYKGTHMYQVKPQHYAAAAAVALVLGTVSGFIAQFIGFFALFYAPLAGTFIGKAVSAVAQHKRGTPLAVVASAGLVLGTIIPAATSMIMMASAVARMPEAYRVGEDSVAVMPLVLSSAASPYSLVFLLIYLLLAVPSMWYWVK